MKAAFLNQMKGNFIGIDEMVLVGVYAFFDSVADYDEPTVADKSKVVAVWDAMANRHNVNEWVTEFAHNKQTAKLRAEKK